MDGGFSDYADGGRTDAVSGAGTRGPNESSGRTCSVEQDDCGRVSVSNTRCGMPVRVRWEDRDGPRRAGRA